MYTDDPVLGPLWWGQTGDKKTCPCLCVSDNIKMDKLN